MSDQKDPVPNTSALFIGTGEFFFAPDAASLAAAAAAGYKSFGNVKAFSPANEMEVKDHYGSYRGVRRIDRRISTKKDISYTLKCDEWNGSLLALMFGASSGTAHTQSVMAAVDGDALVFTETASDPTRWYDLKKSTARVRNLTTVTIATKVEGTDFEVDLLLGRIRFLTTQSASLTPVITGAAITSADAEYLRALTPFGKISQSGYGRLVLFDQGTPKVVLDHCDFSCDIQAKADGEHTGEDFTGFELVVTVTQAPGTVFFRDANA